MPHLYRRGKTWWVQLRQEGHLVRRSLKTRKKNTARRLVSDIKYAVVRGQVLKDLGVAFVPATLPGWTAGDKRKAPFALPSPERTVAVNEVWTRYLEWAGINLRPGTVEQVTISWGLFIAFAQPESLADFTVDTVERFKAHLVESGHKPKTVNNKLTDLRSTLNRMIHLKLFSGPNPVTGIAMLKIPKRPPRFLDSKQVDSLLEASRRHSQDMHLFCALCVLAGLRKGEAIAARWEWVSWPDRTITVQAGHGFTPKDSDCRTIPLSDRLVEILKPYKHTEGYLIATDIEPEQGQRYRVEVRRLYAEVLKSAKIGEVNPHVLRHTFASLLVQSGVSLYKVQAWLGHADAKTTQVYGHLQAYDPDVNRT